MIERLVPINDELILIDIADGREATSNICFAGHTYSSVSCVHNKRWFNL